MIEFRQNDPDTRFKTAESVRRIAEFHILFFRCVRCVVCHDGINGPILQGGAQGFHMVPAAKGRRNAGCRTKGSTGLISQRQMMDRHLARNGHALFLCLANNIHRPFTCNMSDVDMGSCILGNDGIAGNGYIFRDGRNARHTQPCRYGAFVHIARMVHMFLNGMDNERLIKGVHITGRLEHHQGIFHKVPIIGKRHRAPHGHISHFRKFLALFALRNGPNDLYMGIAFFCRSLFDSAYDNRGIDDRVRIRHTGNARNAAVSRCHRPGNDIFLCLKARFTKMGMQVNKAWSNHLSRSIKRFISSLINEISHTFNDPVLHEDILHSIQMLAGIDKMSLFNQRFQLVSPLSVSRIRAPCGPPPHW